MLHPTFVFDTDIPSETFKYMSKLSDPYKYAVMTFINYKNRCFCIVRDIRYRKLISFITEEYILFKSISGLYVNPCATSLIFHLIASMSGPFMIVLLEI
jgi:hypothetical protein